MAVDITKDDKQTHKLYVVEYLVDGKFLTMRERREFEFLLEAHKFYDECVEKYGEDFCVLFREKRERKRIEGNL